MPLASLSRRGAPAAALVALSIGLAACSSSGSSTLTSADVKASLERVLNPKTAAAAASNIATVASISTPTPQTVTLQLTHPDFSILYGLTTTNLSILPAKAITAGTIASQPDGTGPFKFGSRPLITTGPPAGWRG